MSDFKNTAEIWKWLLDGGKIIYNPAPEYNIFELKGGCLFCCNVKQTYFQNDHSLWNKYIEPKWYENIPEHGVLVKYKNGGIFVVYETSGMSCKSVGNYWVLIEDLTPLTNEEIKKFLLPSN